MGAYLQHEVARRLVELALVAFHADEPLFQSVSHRLELAAGKRARNHVVRAVKKIMRAHVLPRPLHSATDAAVERESEGGGGEEEAKGRGVGGHSG